MLGIAHRNIPSAARLSRRRRWRHARAARSPPPQAWQAASARVPHPDRERLQSSAGAREEPLDRRPDDCSDRYRVLFLPHVLEPEKRRIYVLPNPFSAKARDAYRVVGSGLKYRFPLDSA